MAAGHAPLCGRPAVIRRSPPPAGSWPSPAAPRRWCGRRWCRRGSAIGGRRSTVLTLRPVSLLEPLFRPEPVALRGERQASAIGARGALTPHRSPAPAPGCGVARRRCLAASDETSRRSRRSVRSRSGAGARGAPCWAPHGYRATSLPRVVAARAGPRPGVGPPATRQGLPRLGTRRALLRRRSRFPPQASARERRLRARRAPSLRRRSSRTCLPDKSS